MIRGAPRPPPAAAPPAPLAAAYPASGEGWMCLYVGLAAAPPDFGTAERLRGPGGSYLAHVASATGCGCKLRGAGSGEAKPVGVPEAPLHLHVTAPEGNPAALEAGVKYGSTGRALRRAAEGTQSSP